MPFTCIFINRKYNNIHLRLWEIMNMHYYWKHWLLQRNGFCNNDQVMAYFSYLLEYSSWNYLQKYWTWNFCSEIGNQCLLYWQVPENTWCVVWKYFEEIKLLKVSNMIRIYLLMELLALVVSFSMRSSWSHLKICRYNMSSM